MMWFSPAVPVRSAAKPGLTHNISNVQAASEQLLTWTRRGPRWRNAVQVCHDALAGKRTPDEARKAFEAAAKEAGMLRTVGYSRDLIFKNRPPSASVSRKPVK
jgi:hypothetical protein